MTNEEHKTNSAHVEVLGQLELARAEIDSIGLDARVMFEKFIARTQGQWAELRSATDIVRAFEYYEEQEAFGALNGAVSWMLNRNAPGSMPPRAAVKVVRQVARARAIRLMTNAPGVIGTAKAVHSILVALFAAMLFTAVSSASAGFFDHTFQ